MTIINLGQFGQPRESSIGRGLREGAAALSNTIENRRNREATIQMQREAMRSNEDIATLDRSSRERVAMAGVRSSRTAAFADAQVKQEDMKRKAADKLIDDLSLHMNGLNETEREIFVQSEQYKAAAKEIKSVLPDYVDKDGKLLLRENNAVFEAQLTKMKSFLTNKVQTGQKLSEGEQRALDMFSNIEPQLLAIAMDKASANKNRWMVMSEKEKAEAVNEQLRILMEARNILRQGSQDVRIDTQPSAINNALRGAASGAGVADALQPNSNDPLGILGGR